MGEIITATAREFFGFLTEGMRASLPWMLAILIPIGAALIFHGRAFARWLWPIAIVAALFWAIRHYNIV